MPNPKDKRKKLHKYLYDNEYYDYESFEDFEQDFGNAANQLELYNFLVENKITKVDKEDFLAGFFGDVNDEVIQKKKEAVQAETPWPFGEEPEPQKKEPKPKEQPEPKEQQLETPTETMGKAMDYITGPEELPWYLDPEKDLPMSEQDAKNAILSSSNKTIPNSPTPLADIPSLDDLDLSTFTIPGQNTDVIEQDVVLKHYNQEFENMKKKRQMLDERLQNKDLQKGEYDRLVHELDKKMSKKANQMNQRHNQLNNLSGQQAQDVMKMEEAIATMNAAIDEKEWEKDTEGGVKFDRYGALKGKANELLLKEMEKAGIYDPKATLLDIELEEAGDVGLQKMLSKKGEGVNALLGKLLYGETDKYAQVVDATLDALDSSYVEKDGKLERPYILSKQERNSLQTYLMQQISSAKKEQKVQLRFEEGLDKLGIPKIDKKEAKAAATAIKDMQDEFNKSVAQYTGQIAKQGEALDLEFDNKVNNFLKKKKQEYDAKFKLYQEQVDAGTLDPKEANRLLLEYQDGTKAQLEAIKKDYGVKFNNAQSLNIKMYGDLDKTKKEIDKKIEEFSKKYQYTDEEKAKMKLYYETILDQENVNDKARKDEAWKNMYLWDKATVATMGGFNNLFEGVFGGVKYFTPDSMWADKQMAKVDMIREAAPRKDFGEWTGWQLMDTDWWLTNAGEQLPIMMPLMGAGGLAMRGASALSKPFLPMAYRQALGAAVGGVSSRLLEANFEGYLTFEQALKQGKSYADAVKSFKDVRNKNMYLMVSDATQLYFTFARGAKINANYMNGQIPIRAKNIAKFGGNAGIQIFTEGYEETFQEWLQALQTNPYLTFAQFSNSEAGKEIFWVGGMMGVGMSVSMSGGLVDRSAVGQINTMIDKYYNKIDKESLTIEEAKVRMHEINLSITQLMEQGVLTEDQVQDARKKVAHVNTIYEQSKEGLLPFSNRSNAFKEYSQLTYEQEQVQRQIEEIDKKIPNQQQLTEKKVLEARSEEINKRVDELLNDGSAFNYMFNGTALSKSEFESLVFDPKNRKGIIESEVETDNPILKRKMIKRGITLDKSIARAENDIIDNTDVIRRRDGVINSEVVNNRIGTVDEKIADIDSQLAELEKQEQEVGEISVEEEVVEQVDDEKPIVGVETKSKYELEAERRHLENLKIDLEVYRDRLVSEETKPKEVQPQDQEITFEEATTAAPIEEAVAPPPVEPVEEVTPAEVRRRVDLFPEESEFADVIGGSGENSILSNYNEVNGIGVASYTNPQNGLVDVIMSGTSDNDYVGYVRVYENGKPTNRWTSKMSNESGNKENFKTMISEVQSRLPEDHEYTETTNISIDGVRIYSNQLNRGYEVLTDENGNPVTNTVTLNAASVQGLQQATTQAEKQSLYDDMFVNTKEQFNELKDKIKALMPNVNVIWNKADNTVQIKLPVLVKSKKAKPTEVEPVEEVTPAEVRRRVDMDKVDPEIKQAVGVINAIGPSLSDATQSMVEEYDNARKLLEEKGYEMEVGILYEYVDSDVAKRDEDSKRRRQEYQEPVWDDKKYYNMDFKTSTEGEVFNSETNEVLDVKPTKKNIDILAWGADMGKDLLADNAEDAVYQDSGNKKFYYNAFEIPGNPKTIEQAIENMKVAQMGAGINVQSLNKKIDTAKLETVEYEGKKYKVLDTVEGGNLVVPEGADVYIDNEGNFKASSDKFSQEIGQIIPAETTTKEVAPKKRKSTLLDLKRKAVEKIEKEKERKKRKPVLFAGTPTRSGNITSNLVSDINKDEAFLEFYGDKQSDVFEFLPTTDRKKLKRMFSLGKVYVLPILESMGIKTAKEYFDALDKGAEIIPGKVEKRGSGYVITEKAKIVMPEQQEATPETTAPTEVTPTEVTPTEVTPIEEVKYSEDFIKEAEGYGITAEELQYIRDNADYFQNMPAQIFDTPERIRKSIESAKRYYEQQGKAKPLEEKTTEANTPKDAAQDIDRGYRVIDGIKYNRPEKVENVERGGDTSVFFSVKEEVPATFVLMEADDVQQSHMKGKANQNFFLQEAQPKERGKGAFMAKTGIMKAQNFVPALSTIAAEAYSGAPIVNERGEVIQGNGRTEAVKITYNEFQGSAEEYKQFLKDNAEKWGLTAEQVEKMDKPILVRQVQVSDSRAINLGQFNEWSLRDAPSRTTIAVSRVRKLTPKQKDAAAKPLSELDPDLLTTKKGKVRDLSTILREAGLPLFEKLNKMGILSDQEFLEGTSRGYPVDDLIDAVKNFYKQLALDGGIPELSALLDGLPTRVLKGIEAAIPTLLNVSKKANILPDLHNAIVGLEEYLLDLKAKKVTSFDQWKVQTDIFNFQPVPAERYSPVTLALIEALATMKQTEITEFFNDYNKLTKEGISLQSEMFAQEVVPLTKEEAINELLNKEIPNEVRETQSDVSGDVVETETIATTEPTDTKEQSKEIQQPSTTPKELPTLEDESQAEGQLVDMSFVGTDNAMAYYDEQVNEGVAPEVARQRTLDLLEQSPLTPESIEEVKKMIDEKMAQDNQANGITPEATKIQNEVVDTDKKDTKKIEELSEANDALLDSAELPTELTEELIDELYNAGLINEKTAQYAKKYLTDPNPLRQLYYESALGKLGDLKESAKTSKKSNKKPTTKKVKEKAKNEKKKRETKAKEEKPKSVQEKRKDNKKKFKEGIGKLKDILGKLPKGPEQKSGEVTILDVIDAGLDAAYFGLEELAAENAATPENINKASWEKMMKDALGPELAAVVEPYLDMMWNEQVVSSIDPNQPTIAEHAANLRAKAKTAKQNTGVDFTAPPTTKQGKPKVEDAAEAKKLGKRPPLQYTNYDALPSKVDEYVEDSRYGDGLDKNQRFTVNTAMTNWLSNGKKAFLLHDSMGVGKTRQMLAAAKEMSLRTGKEVLIVTESKTIIDDSFLPDAADMGIDLNASNIKITTYTQLKKQSGNKYGLIIYDEAHNLKNPGKTFQYAGEVDSDHVMYATATPGDKVGAAVYFLADIAGMTRSDFAAELGLQAKDGKWEMMPGASEVEAVTKINDLIQQAYEDGMAIRKSYPFWGSVIESTVPLDPLQVEQIDNVSLAYDDQLAQIKPGTYYDQRTGEMKHTDGRRKWHKAYKGMSEAMMEIEDERQRKELNEQKINALDKLAETFKAKQTAIEIASQIAEGRQVVVMSANVNELEVRGLTDGKYGSKTKVPSFLQNLKEELQARGIDFAIITGNTKNKKAEIDKFQSGEVSVIIGSLQSMSTGINLDDTVGTKPRALYIASASYDANKFDQAKGRVSRRNTKSASTAVILYGDTGSENKKRGKVNKKGAMLSMFQGEGISDTSMQEIEAAEAMRQAERPKKKAKEPYIEDSGKGFVVKDSYDIKGILKGLGAKPRYEFVPQEGTSRKKKQFVGWYFDAHRKEEIEQLLEDYNNGNLDVEALQYAQSLYEDSSLSWGSAGKTAQAASAKGRKIGKYARIDVAPITGGKPKKFKQLFKDAKKRLKWIVSYKKPRSEKAAGVYNSATSQIRIRTVNDLDVIAHELGHFLDDVFQLGPAFGDSSWDFELEKYWGYGSTPKPGVTRDQWYDYVRKEGMAEFIRAVIYNPAAAKKQSPALFDHVMSKLDDKAKEGLMQFSEDIRTLHGASPIEQSLASTELNPLDVRARRSAAENRAVAFNNFLDRHGFKNVNQSRWYLSWYDRLRKGFADRMFPARKSFEEMMKINGYTDKDILPADDFRIMGRLFAGIGSKINNMLNNGLIGLEEGIGYQRLIDPKTKQEITIDWLMNPIYDTINTRKYKRWKSKNIQIREFQDLVGAYMTAERTLEYERKFGRSYNLSGIGDGLGVADADQARMILDEFDKLPAAEKEAIKEAARRYRVFANGMLQYLADHGRMTQDMVDTIIANNTQYVAMQRVMEIEPGQEFTWSDRAGGVLKTEKAKGGTQNRYSPYDNLMTNFYKTIEEGDRNNLLNAFFDVARKRKGKKGPRGFYEGEIAPITHIAEKVTLAPDASVKDKNIVVVYNNGEKEFWEVNPDIYRSLSYFTGGPARSGSRSGFEMAMRAVASVWKMNAKLIRFTVTANPIFAFGRNIPRDVQSRLVQSRTAQKSSLKDYREHLESIGHSAAEVDALMAELKKKGTEWRNMFDLFGADQAGYYTKSRKHYYAALDAAIRKEARKGSIIVDANTFFNGFDNYMNFLAKGERYTRIKEYKSAFKYAKTKLGYDDYNAGIYAAYQARDLMDFAVIGEYMQFFNQIIPFSNAALQGTKRMIKGFAENINDGLEKAQGGSAFAKAFSVTKELLYGNLGRWGLVNVAPSLLMLALSRSLGYEDEYDDMPAYQKDMFYNFKIPGVSDEFIRIPKPFELGIMATGVERTITAITKDQSPAKAFQGYEGSLATAMLPFKLEDFLGPMKPIVETYVNHSFFYGNSIIPHREKELAVPLRKGFKEKKGSNLGHLIYQMTGTDPRNVDYITRSYFTYYGRGAQILSNMVPRSMFDYFGENDKDDDVASNMNMNMESVFNAFGMIGKSSPYKLRSVQNILDKAKKYGLSRTQDVKGLYTNINAVLNAEKGEMRQTKINELAQYAVALEKEWSKKIPELKKIMQGGTKTVKRYRDGRYVDVEIGMDQIDAIKKTLFNN